MDCTIPPGPWIRTDPCILLSSTIAGSGKYEERFPLSPCARLEENNRPPSFLSFPFSCHSRSFLSFPNFFVIPNEVRNLRFLSFRPLTERFVSGHRIKRCRNRSFRNYAFRPLRAHRQRLKAKSHRSLTARLKGVP